MTTLLHESPLIREVIDPDCVRTLIEEHLAQKQNHNHVLWGLMTVAVWHHRFLEA
jgi:asparagine synthase (glutamine-hydrolysing)